MAISYVENADTRQDLGPSGIIQQNTASFSASDYVAGGYPVLPVAFGMARISSLIVGGMSGSTTSFIWIYDYTLNPGRLRAYTALGTEVTAGAPIGTGTLRLLAYGF